VKCELTNQQLRKTLARETAERTTSRRLCLSRHRSSR
jgi:hypothetical protein